MDLVKQAQTSAGPPGIRPFEFGRDTFAYSNELLWAYQFDAATSKTTFLRRDPKPDYVLRCFVLARVARQFLYHARFAPEQPVASVEVYQRLTRHVIARNPRIPGSPDSQIMIPGFANLHEFSRVHETWLKVICGGVWGSYFMRSHWRMVFPISRGHQTRTAARMAAAIARNHSPIVHLINFPSLSINHGMILFGVTETPVGFDFQAYDPNDCLEPVRLAFDRATQSFNLPANNYWPGGSLNVLEIYNTWLL